MSYYIKEIYYTTIQGEGANVGRAAVFCRFAGCNLWSGREEDRVTVVCQFCDTDFVGTNGPGGGVFGTPGALAHRVRDVWGGGRTRDALVVCTGGEPLLQLDPPLLSALHARGFQVAVETNGTRRVSAGVDWTCVSPKAGAELVVHHGQELKLVFPQEGVRPSDFESMDFEHFYLQPMDGPALVRNVELATEYCLRNPLWRLGLQMHKYVGIP